MYNIVSILWEFLLFKMLYLKLFFMENIFYFDGNFQGDLEMYLKRKGRLSLSKALKLALDIARQVNS